jgi:hypothetical protein
LIADDEYSSYMENRYWRQLADDGIVPSSNMEIIQKMQSIHDDVDIDVWFDDLVGLAAERNLNTSVLEEFK